MFVNFQQILRKSRQIRQNSNLQRKQFDGAGFNLSAIFSELTEYNDIVKHKELKQACIQNKRFRKMTSCNI